MGLDHPLVVGVAVTLLASGITSFAVLAKFARRVDATMDDLRDHVIPHFRPATIDELRTGVRAEGDTIPVRTAVLEHDLAVQTKALSDHLDSETCEARKTNERLTGIEQTLSTLKKEN